MSTASATETLLVAVKVSTLALSLFQHLSMCWQEHELLQEIAPGFAAPVMRLAAAVFTYVSQELSAAQQLPAARLQQLRQLWEIAGGAAQSVAAAKAAAVLDVPRSDRRLSGGLLDLTHSSLVPAMPCYHGRIPLAQLLAAAAGSITKPNSFNHPRHQHRQK